MPDALSSEPGCCASTQGQPTPTTESPQRLKPGRIKIDEQRDDHQPKASACPECAHLGDCSLISQRKYLQVRFTLPEGFRLECFQIWGSFPAFTSCSHPKRADWYKTRPLPRAWGKHCLSGGGKLAPIRRSCRSPHLVSKYPVQRVPQGNAPSPKSVLISVHLWQSPWLLFVLYAPFLFPKGDSSVRGASYHTNKSV